MFCTPVRPTKARRLEMFFSKSLASSNIYGYVHEDSQYADLSLEDLKNNTKIRIAVKENDTHHDIVQKYFSYARIVRLPQLAPVGTEIEYVLDNRADIAFWEDKLVDKYLVDRDIAPDILIQK